MASPLEIAALEYHEFPSPGKISVVPTKELTNQRDLALAYSPGVAFACKSIEADPAIAARLTSRANLVGVVTNGTAVLGLGNIGPLASKPVMEGKACLFKKFAGIDVFDIELAENDPDKLVDIIWRWNPPWAALIWRTSKHRNVSTLKRNFASACKFRSSTTISTAQQSLLVPQSPMD